jgi:putative DNA primase/helicase
MPGLNIENIPAELKVPAQWVVYDLNKIPHSPGSGKRASSTDPATWGSFNQAIAATKNGCGWQGIGFVFSVDDPICGIDIDRCRDPESGAIEPWAAKILSDLDSYSEISVSGSGVHTLVRGKKPGTKCKAPYGNGHVEIYDHSRFFIVTGDRLDGYPQALMERTDRVEALYDLVFSEPSEMPSASEPQTQSPIFLDDEKILRMAWASKTGAKFTALWNRDIAEYPSQSEADLALCNSLAFWCGKDPGQIDRLFRQSRLMRPKWNKSVGQGQTYGQRTIGKAIQGCAEIYQPTVTRSPAATTSSSPPTCDINLTSFNLTDSGNAEIFTGLFSDKVRYDHSRGIWLKWNGLIWQPDKDGTINRMALKAVREKFMAAGKNHTLTTERRQAIAKHALSSESRARLSSMLELAQSMPPLADTGEEWDADPDLIAVKNGILNLKTGELQDAHPDMKISKKVDITYCPNTPAPRWVRFLEEIFKGNTNLINYIQLAIGLSLTGHTREQCLFILFGRGANGKSLLLAILRLITGDYGYNAPFTTFEMDTRASIPQDLAMLKGRRVVTASETTENSRLNEGRLKALTGEDAVTARELYRRDFTYQPQCKIWLAVNHRPRVFDDSFGFWRRVRMIPLTQTFDPAQEPNLLDTLKNEAEGILAWAWAGAMKWYESGLGAPPETVLSAVRDYQTDQDPISEWLFTRCNQAPSLEIRAQIAFENYQAWAEEAKLTKRETLGRTRFGRILSDRFDKERKSLGIVYYGLALKGDM